MKTATTITRSYFNRHFVLILIGVVIAIISILALGLELRSSWPVFNGYQTAVGWFSTISSQTIQWLKIVMV